MHSGILIRIRSWGSTIVLRRVRPFPGPENPPSRAYSMRQAMMESLCISKLMLEEFLHAGYSTIRKPDSFVETEHFVRMLVP